MNKIKRENRLNGYSLLEVVLVMFVVSASFVGIYSLYANTIRADVESRYEMQATNLAQEGVEIVRNMRDNYILTDPDDWLGETTDTAGKAVFDCVGGGKKCVPYLADSNAGVFALFATNDSDFYYLWTNPDNYAAYFNCGDCSMFGLSKTDLRRWIEISSIAADQIKVTCFVRWNSFSQAGLEREAKVEAVLTKWEP